MPFESGLCVYVNIVSAMTDGLPPGYQHVVRPANALTRWHGPAYCHLNVRIDQLTADEWDFRIFHWDSNWSWSWKDAFAHTMGAIVNDMTSAPAAPLLRPQSGLAQGASDDSSTGWASATGLVPGTLEATA